VYGNFGTKQPTAIFLQTRERIKGLTIDCGPPTLGFMQLHAAESYRIFNSCAVSLHQNATNSLLASVNEQVKGLTEVDQKGVRVNSKKPSSHTKAVRHRWAGWTGVW